METQPTDREELFEMMFGYPMCLAQSVINASALSMNLETELYDYHADRLAEVDRLLADD